jgi:hypothetical protein
MFVGSEVVFSPNDDGRESSFDRSKHVNKGESPSHQGRCSKLVRSRNSQRLGLGAEVQNASAGDVQFP